MKAIRRAGFVVASLWMASMAQAQTPPFTQCPAIGLDTSCAILIVFQANGAIMTVADPSQGPYDGVEDTLLAVQNNSGHPICSLPLKSTQDIFGFDGDGICVSGGAPGCPFGPTGYEGPGTSFDVVSPFEGTVNFNPCIPAGGSAYFSLEEIVDVNELVTGGETAPAPTASPLTLGAMMIALTAVGAWLVQRHQTES